MDKELKVLDIIDRNKSVNQREISSISNLSLGTVNLLINKMLKEGLLKIKKIPANRIVYMLTPKGMTEKINKLNIYIKNHYESIDFTRNDIENYLLKLKELNGTVHIIISDDEISKIVMSAVKKHSGFVFITENELPIDYKVIVTADESIYLRLLNKGISNIHLYPDCD